MTKSQDSVHRPQLLQRKESRSKFERFLLFWSVCVCVCVSSPLRDVLSASVGPVSESELEICSV